MDFSRLVCLAQYTWTPHIHNHFSTEQRYNSNYKKPTPSYINRSSLDNHKNADKYAFL